MEMTGKKVLVALAVFAIVGPLVYTAGDNGRPYTFLSGTITPDSAYPGAEMTVDWRIKVNRLCPSTVQRVLVDSFNVRHVYALAPGDTAVQLGDTHLLRTFTLPYGMPAGPARYSSVLTNICNPLHLIWPLVYETPEITFTIDG